MLIHRLSMTVGGAGTPAGLNKGGYSDANQFNLNAYYQPLDSGWMPSVSVLVGASPALTTT